MKTNIEKYNYYKNIILRKNEDYLNSIFYNIPKTFYIIHQYDNINDIGKIEKCNITAIRYNNIINYRGDKPTKIEIEKIKKIAESDIIFTKNKIWFDYSGESFSSSINYEKLYNSDNICFDIKNANIKSDLYKKEQEFLLLNKKDENYNYEANGYKFLGWLNNWKFPIIEKDHSEYANCLKLKHKLIDAEHVYGGNEITVSCPICKIYWMYYNGD
jgi:hypothetical protein